VQTNIERVSKKFSKYHLGITKNNIIWTSQSIILNNTWIENLTIGSHLCENRMSRTGSRTKKIQKIQLAPKKTNTKI
jgi:hypothetical protein